MPITNVKPTKLELTILRAMWQRGPGTVREIQDTLNETRTTGYTTVLKMLQIMTEKGLVDRDESVRPQVFRARYSEEKTQQHILRDLIQRAFNGSVKSLVMQALATRKASGKDLDAMKLAAIRLHKLVNEVEGKAMSLGFPYALGLIGGECMCLHQCQQRIGGGMRMAARSVELE